MAERASNEAHAVGMADPIGDTLELGNNAVAELGRGIALCDTASVHIRGVIGRASKGS